MSHYLKSSQSEGKKYIFVSLPHNIIMPAKCMMRSLKLNLIFLNCLSNIYLWTFYTSVYASNSSKGTLFIPIMILINHCFYQSLIVHYITSMLHYFNAGGRRLLTNHGHGLVPHIFQKLFLKVHLVTCQGFSKPLNWSLSWTVFFFSCLYLKL